MESKNLFDRLPDLKRLITDNGLQAKHQLGQHFLTDRALLDEIAAAAKPLDAHSIIEIGPGPGGLTRSLLQAGAKQVFAIEKDRRFLPHLQAIQALSGQRLHLIEGDALAVKPTDIAPPPYKIVANLPYNIASPLLVNFLIGDFANDGDIDEMVVMVQDEVAMRMIATPSTPHYGRLAVLTYLCAEAEKIMLLPPALFTPPPKVNSALVRLRPLPPTQAEKLRKNIALETILWLVKHGFAKRRKMLRSALKSLKLGVNQWLDIDKWLDRAQIDGNLRAENLSPEDFVRLAAAYLALKP